VLLDENESGTGLSALLQSAHMTVTVYNGESDTSGSGTFFTDSYDSNPGPVAAMGDALTRGVGVVASGFGTAILNDYADASCQANTFGFQDSSDAIAPASGMSGHPIVAGVTWSAPRFHWVIGGDVVNSATVVAVWAAAAAPAILYRDSGTGSRVVQYTSWGAGSDFPATANGIMWAAHCK
jgi:hypothetical protein